MLQNVVDLCCQEEMLNNIQFKAYLLLMVEIPMRFQCVSMQAVAQQGLPN